MPFEAELVEVPHDMKVIEVKPEIWNKGWVYVAEDCRMELLIVSQRLHFIAEAIDLLCNQFVSVSSLSESATCRLKGRTAGAWVVRRVSHEDAPSLLGERRPRFQRLVLAVVNPRAWKLARTIVKNKDESDCKTDLHYSIQICENDTC